ncbi:M24 family metallopeptidase [Schnuerera sp. xch1]|uniref:M24 family metallopeptidase n=1 Tax=Schnuerera sp. xch1 TaxID=2874283 RepID=UPI001CBAB0B9|nr:M24 family metallopeptidase [Schnuerera sp. xch1]
MTIGTGGEDVNLTLKGHINLMNARFLYGSTGSNLDSLCRYPLWQEGFDYKCSTGHEVGFLLNVHEGPHRISPKPNNVKLGKGMVMTIEPGVYKERKHGIRIENVAVVNEDVKLLTEKEKRWLNDCHKEVYNKLFPYLNDDQNE